jgi:excisionase family DNA binding protein
LAVRQRLREPDQSQGIQVDNFTKVEHRTDGDFEVDKKRSQGIGTSAFEPLLDSEEAAALLKIHPKTLQKLAREGKVCAIQIGKLWRFRASALNRWLEEIAR